MKKWISLFSLVAFMGLVLSAFSSTASAQLLDNTWFKILVVTKGYSLDSMGDVRKSGAKAFVYMYVTWNDGESEYNCDVWSETSDGVWEVTTNSSFNMEKNGVLFLPDNGWNIATPNATFHFYQTSVIWLRSFADSLRSASFRSLGAEVNSGTLDDGSSFYGGALLVGASVPASRIPFEP